MSIRAIPFAVQNARAAQKGACPRIRPSHRSLAVPSIRFRSGNPSDLEIFRDRAFKPELPLKLKSPERFTNLSVGEVFGIFEKYESTIMPYEYRPGSESKERTGLKFLRECAKKLDFSVSTVRDGSWRQFHAPLRLFFNALRPIHNTSIKSLYIAQMSLDDLPPGMKALFPAPMDIIQCGRGDVYGSSIWMGIPPTYTPLHKDPNPNIFTQYCSTKTVRLFRPEIGTALFHHMQNLVGSNSSASFRGGEMMQGPEFETLERLVLHEGSPGLDFKTVLFPGDSLFIPKGWWHTVRSVSRTANISANWWFR